MSTDPPVLCDRFWCRREGQSRLDWHGYLADPAVPFGRTLNPDLFKLTELSDRPWLALLGEAGMGKTTAMQAERTALERAAEASGDELAWHDLGEYGEESRLIRELFEGDRWDRWRGGDRTLHLYLDGLDECRLHVPTVARLLLNQFSRLTTRDRLKVRVSCRTGPWPHLLEAGLKGLWPDAEPSVFELMPLRRRDVEAVAAALGVADVGAFLAEVERRDAVPLASRPLTLRMLAAISRRGGRLPESRAELYQQGCLALCEEVNPSRRDAGKLGLLNPDQRLAVASRLAATMIFCGRPAIWDVPDHGRPESDLPVPAVSGGTEAANGADFPVTDDGIREVLSDTGLFSLRGPWRLGWSHRTYAEYLAALYVRERGLAVEQIEGLILHPHPPGKVVPQLQGAAAWLAGMVPAAFRSILASDPRVLLLSDVENADPAARGALVAALLEAADAGRIADTEPDLRLQYRKLAHPGLAGQLEPYIRDRSGRFVSRRMAIDIAQACTVREVQGPLVEVALDPRDRLEIRVEAADAIGQVGDEPTRGRLRELLEGGLVEDAEDQLLGCVLRALWPGLVSAREVFSRISRPRRESFYGTYQAFLHGKLAQGLAVEDVPLALAWAVEQGEYRHLSFDLRLLIDGLVLRAWEASEQPEVLRALADLITARCRSCEPLFDGPFAGDGIAWFAEDDARRRRLLVAMLPAMAEEDETVIGWIPWVQPPLLRSHDQPWLVGLLDGESEPANRRALARLVRSSITLEDLSEVDMLREAAARHRELAREICPIIEPVKLGSPEAERARHRHERLVAQRAAIPSVEPCEPPISERIERSLASSESGDCDAWCGLSWALAFDPAQPHRDRFWAIELDSKPGWDTASPETCSRILEAALGYVLARSPDSERWFAQRFVYSEAAGVAALLLLLDRGAGRLEELPPDAWRKWVPILVGYLDTGRDDVRRAWQRLLVEAYRRVPDEVIEWLIRLVDAQSAREAPYFDVRILDGLADDRTDAAILAKASDPELEPVLFGQLLGHLLDRAVPGAGRLAASLLVTPVPEDEGRREKTIVAARALMLHTPDAGWPVLWPLLRAETGFGRDLMLSVSGVFERSTSVRLGSRLTEEHIADLYLWLSRKFPHEEDRDSAGVPAAGPREEVARLRDGLLADLERKGTPAALEGIGRIARELSHLEWLDATRLRAEQVVLERTWVAPEPSHFRALVADREARLVEGGDQLLAVVVASLRRYERKLQGETPANFMLWDRQHGVDKKQIDRYRPKEEERLSDALKLHLEEDLVRRGIVANREVEIRSGQGRSPGEETDIHVDAVAPGPRDRTLDRIRLVVEVKGCWNRQVRQAMEDQLRDRYLREGPCRHGLYVVGWYLCDAWDSGDYRKGEARRQVPEGSVSDAQAFFDAQALSLSHGDVTVRAVVLDATLGGDDSRADRGPSGSS